MAAEPTKRAYTLRLTGTDPTDQTWREALWHTHEAVNQGAKVFGNWLLTLRGGLDHRLADEVAQDSKNPDTVRRNARILLALSWLSVESDDGAPAPYVVATAADPQRKEKVVAALQDILKSSGLEAADIAAWVRDCQDSLSAAIRDDAVWVNRRAAFDELANKWNSLAPADARQVISEFFGEPADYLSLPESAAATARETDEDFSHIARAWLSTNWGSGKKSDKTQIATALETLADADLSPLDGRPGPELAPALLDCLGVKLAPGQDAEEELRKLVGWTTGRPSKGRSALTTAAKLPTLTRDELSKLQRKFADEAAEKRPQTGAPSSAWSTNLRQAVEQATTMRFKLHRDLIGEYSTMLDQAARRVSQAHTWLKRAEARRQKDLADKQKLKQVPAEVCDWLDRFCEERSLASGALAGYHIRPRAIDGWDNVVKAWSKTDCETEADRIAAARAVEADPEVEKFGDIQLFEALAADDAIVVWQSDGKANPQLLKDYVAAKAAEDRLHRYKVPAYRHPDPLLHPVFCEFGCSRWTIKFGIHQAWQALAKAKGILASARSEDEKMKANVRVLKAQKKVEQRRQEFEQARAAQRLTMDLWTGNDIKTTEMRWQSKRMPGDLAFATALSDSPVFLPRADRLGRAAGGAALSDAPAVSGLFEQNEWNGRLQAPRPELEAIARCQDPQRKTRLRSRLNWLITFSAELQPQGPMIAFAAAHDLQIRNSPLSTAKFLHVNEPRLSTNEGRKGYARFTLPPLSGLRVLSVDLGHRYAAACAVWETISETRLAELCKAAGHRPPQPKDMALHLPGQRNGKKVKTIFRRTGPAMWARLDRQFTIKLQGEDKPSRKASTHEFEAVVRFEKELGRTRSDENPRPHDVMRLMAEAVRSARLGLRRHGDRARIAFNLTTKTKLLPGGRTEKLTPETSVELLQDTLVLWHNLRNSPTWQDDFAESCWNESIAPLLENVVLPEPPVEGAAAQTVKAFRRTLRDKLKPAAQKLAGNPQLRQKLHTLWATRWRKDDEAWRGRLRWLRDWLLPRGKAKSDASIRHVGGITLTRLATIRGLWQTQKAFALRPDPDDLRRNVPKRGASSERFGQRVLDALDHLRENRIKQLASRIVEAALGIGKEQPKVNRRDPKRQRSQVHSPCHAVVIEDLKNYRFADSRPRRENRQLMQWSARNVRRYLAEACRLYGLHLCEVFAGYTSRQDSRTGAPGCRATDLPVPDFLKRYDRLVKNAEGEERKFLEALKARWDGCTDRSKLVRILDRAGKLFVSADESSPAVKGIQADLNAAANIGLRALLDPDWPGKWWWVPCGKDGKPAKEKCKGTRAFDLNLQLLPATECRGKDIVNAWRDVSADPIVPGEGMSYAEYWNRVKARVVVNLRRQAGL